MILQTEQMQNCGEGTPMCSRLGKATSFQYRAFVKQEKPAKEKGVDPEVVAD